ncbi:BAR-domain-containing protein [Yamadazyma tenuis ATCC 10573]|uniref:BAR-domain-containing protein n=1 Tax=Candida tenuis (strain ATCC 10573 / BCRC 21748 / CBS 615 / JCM 9827 / NBRC 10315 / NRRL Y-1498 / VKM Y-70) TaxID=590646 RepID=G3B9X0_CANTC|nr:BAR-domain-containing protein [Yamadazyma tenuis ATCC 10573]EGV61346.1 BAR-domain-containing protein [Yamadazyma tenuis ATCC 10573]
MSWNGLKKAINRAGTQVKVRTGQIDQTVDRQFDFEEKRFKTMETNSLKLQKELKHYLDSLRILTSAQMNVAEVLKSFYGEDDIVTARDKIEKGVNPDNFSEEYYNVTKDLNDNVLASLEGPYNQTILNSVARFNSYFIEINDAIKKRANKKLDYDAMKKKLQTMVENPKSNEINTNEYEAKLSEIKSELEDKRAMYENLNDKLKQELPQLINLRVPFLNPSFESFIKLQLRFFNEGYSSLNNLQLRLDANLRQDYINGNLESRLDDVLMKMRELNITGSR